MRGLIVAHAQLLPRLEPIRARALTDAVVVGGTGSAIDGLTVHDETALSPADADLPPLAREIAPWDTQSIIYTSGTTGPSKGVMSSYLQLYSMGVESLVLHRLRGPLHGEPAALPRRWHGGGVRDARQGGSISVVDAFDTASFWSTVRETGTTTAILLGVMAGFLAKQPPSPRDRDHPLRTAIMVPLGEDASSFSRRFGCDVYTVFNMTEISTPLVSGPNPSPVGTCGRPRSGVDVRIVDEHDCEVEPGEVGELIVRTDRPWAMNHGYFRNPEATARAWRNGWFHTGTPFASTPRATTSSSIASRTRSGGAERTSRRSRSRPRSARIPW
jgi:crotonobetaine/carnitine-CoA ligase